MVNENNNQKKTGVLVIIELEQLNFLKSKGMNRSKFMRQAIEAYKKGIWTYKFLDEKEN